MMNTHAGLSQPVTLDRTHLVLGACALLVLFAIIGWVSAPFAMSAVYMSMGLLVLIQSRLLLTAAPSPFVGGAFGLSVELLTTAILLQSAPPLIFITGWIVWGAFTLGATMFVVCFFAAWSRILLPVETPARSVLLFWAGMSLVLLSYVAIALYFTYILI
jgi:hypothetical protein